VRSYLPRGNMLDTEAFRQRHLLLSWILGLHVPALFAFGMWQGFGAEHSALEVAIPAACLVLARLARHRRLASFFVTAGLVFCSSVLVHLSGGMIEAHFHFFILVGLIGLYQDWVPFLWNVTFTVLSHGLGSGIAADLMFNHAAGQNQPWTWAVIHGVSVLAACIGVIIFWKNTEIEQQRNVRLAEDLADAELSAAQREAERRRSVSELFVSLARRNQSLLDRQLGLIAELEQREQQPEALAELFHLDHLATRIRRNAESLIVLSGAEPPRRWGNPVPLGEVVRAAAAEVEDYDRVEVLVSDHLEVAGHAVADVAHMLAELIENATVYSPPSSEVRVRSHVAPIEWSAFVLSIEDSGIGMSEDDLARANQLLADPPDVDLTHSTLGHHVVARLARRYRISVRVAGTPGGGVTALVTLPNDLVSERRRVPAGPSASPAGPATSAATSVPQAEVGAVVATMNGPSANGAAGLRIPPPAMRPDPPPLDPRPLDPKPLDPAPVDAPPAEPVGETPARGPVHVTAGRPVKLNGRSVTPRAVPPSGSSSVPPSDLTDDGLVRRVPGAGVASLRGAPAPGGAPNGGPPTQAARRDRDPEKRRSMLSRFQASQRAGRAAAEDHLTPPGPEETS
jgi:signal transduction histidine kinase